MNKSKPDFYIMDEKCNNVICQEKPTVLEHNTNDKVYRSWWCNKHAEIRFRIVLSKV